MTSTGGSALTAPARNGARVEQPGHPGETFAGVGAESTSVAAAIRCRTGRASVGWLGFVAIAFLVCLLRPVDAAQRFTFGSEDGTVFTPQARSLGIWESLRTTYSGYLHLLPRLVAAAASALPLSWSPPIYYCAAALVAALAAALSYRCGLGLGLSRAAALLLAGTVLLLPAAGYEAVGNLANVQWYCLAASVVFVASWLGGYRPSARVSCPLLGLAGLTTPLLAVSLLVVVPVALARRRRLDAAVALTVVGAVAVQALARLTSSVPHDQLRAGGQQATRLYAFRVADGSVFGHRLLRMIYVELGSGGAQLAGLAVTLVLLGVSLRADARVRRVCLYLLLSSGLYVVVAIALRPSWFRFHDVGFVPMEGHLDLFDGRYMGVPALCVTLVGLLLADRAYRARRENPVPRRILEVSAAMVGVILLANMPVNLYRPSLADWQAQLTQDRSSCSTTGGQDAVEIVNGPFRGFRMKMTCSQAFGR